MIPRAVCLKCGTKYTGWALKFNKPNYCKCGFALGMVEEKEEKKIIEGDKNEINRRKQKIY